MLGSRSDAEVGRFARPRSPGKPPRPSCTDALSSERMNLAKGAARSSTGGSGAGVSFSSRPLKLRVFLMLPSSCTARLGALRHLYANARCRCPTPIGAGPPRLPHCILVSERQIYGYGLEAPAARRDPGAPRQQPVGALECGIVGVEVDLFEAPQVLLRPHLASV